MGGIFSFFLILKNTLFCNFPEDSCVLTTANNACVTNYEKANSGDAVVVCGSPGEVANDPLDGKNTFHLGGSLMYKLNDTYDIQKKSVWTMIATYSNDQLRQKMAWALSQILVITPNQIDEERQSEIYLNYYGELCTVCIPHTLYVHYIRILFEI